MTPMRAWAASRVGGSCSSSWAGDWVTPALTQGSVRACPSVEQKAVLKGRENPVVGGVNLGHPGVGGRVTSFLGVVGGGGAVPFWTLLDLGGGGGGEEGCCFY